jgi:hypothetical protein
MFIKVCERYLLGILFYYFIKDHNQFLKHLKGMSAEQEKYTFKGALSMLIRHSLKVLSEESVPGAVTGIHNYRARMDATIEKHERVHRNYFLHIFRTHKDEILKGYEFDQWLLENDVRVIFGSENPEASHKGFLPLSSVYKASKECVKKAKFADDQLIIYPQIFLLHLYRIFNSLKETEDFSDVFDPSVCETTEQQMRILETDLKTGSVGESNITNCGLEFPKGIPAHSDPTDALRSMMNDPALDNIFSLVTNTFAQSGMIPQEELSKISVNDIRKQFNSILGSDVLKKTFENMNKTMTAAKTPEEAMRLSMNMMNDPSLIEEFAKASSDASSSEPKDTVE